MACASGGKSVVPEQFPAGLRVLVVDDDVVCLRVLEQMLRRCKYNVTCCSQATVALNLLRERKGCFDIVLSDVHMPDMDGFKLLELVGLEMDLPVIMISADGRTNLVMRGIRHGACDYLIKPIRDEELKNIWQHVVRKRCNGSKDTDQSGSTEDLNRQKRAVDEAENASSWNEGADGSHKASKKRRESKDEEETELESDDSMSKKPRVVWSVELHQQFVGAVNQLGIDKAVPKRILELMNVPGLSRENVASHLQKFRLYLKRLSGVSHQPCDFPGSYHMPSDQNPKLVPLGRFEIQALAASGQLPPQTLAALQAELLSRPAGNLVLTTSMDQPALSKTVQMDRNMAYGQTMVKRSPNILPNETVHSEFGQWSSKNLGNLTESTNGNMMANFIQKPSINVQPSCMVVPSQPSINFQNSPSSVNQIDSFRNSPMGSYNNIAECNPVGTISEFDPSRSKVTDNNSNCTVRNHPVYVGKVHSIPTRFAVDEHEWQLSTKVKQEPNVDFAENVKVGVPVRQNFPQMI